MKEYLDFADFISQIIMHTEPVVIVEGKTDITLFENLFNIKNLIITSPNLTLDDKKNRKNNVINAIRELKNICTINKSNEYKRYLGIVDKDFNEICNNKTIMKNLKYTDKHDIEALIFSSQGFIKLISIFFWDPEKVEIESVRNKCVKIASEFGYYLLSFYENELHHLKDQITPIYLYIDEDLQFNEDLLLNKLEELSHNGEISKEDLKNIMENVNKRRLENLDRYQLSNGHDLMRVLTMLTLWEKYNLKKKRTSKKYKQDLINDIDRRDYLTDELQDMLMASFDFDYFKSTDLYNEIVDYQNKVNVRFIQNSP